MLAGVVCAFLVVGAGFTALCLFGLRRGPLHLGLTPAAGFGLLAVLTSWAQFFHVSDVAAGVVVLGVCTAGLALAVCEYARDVRSCAWRRVDAALLAAGTLIPLVVLAQAITVRGGVPNYTFDGPFHAEAVDALRRGEVVPGMAWYPTGFHAPAAALLALAPWIDSASGVVAWACALTLLSPLAVFGLAIAVWRDVRIGAVAAVLLALTSTFPYEVQLYSEWPMAAGLLLTTGLWAVGFEYLRAPSIRLAMLGGLLTGALLLTHGTELYTAVIGLLALAITRWHLVRAVRVLGHVTIGTGAAAMCAASYVPALLRWSAAGGAVVVGNQYFDVHQATILHEPLLETLFWSSAASTGLLVDLPLRLALLGIGTYAAFRRRGGRVVPVLAAVFLALVLVFRYVDVGLVRQVFALTLPWAVDGRLLMTLPILAAPLGALGVVVVAHELARRASTPGATWTKLMRRALVLGLGTAAASILLVAGKFSVQSAGIATYSADDAAAFAWLRQHAHPGDVVLNDGTADAGIWAPYKARVSIVLPQSRHVAPNAPEVLVRSSLAALDARQDVRAAACDLSVTYVYHGEASSTTEYRQFPDIEELRANAALEEVFSSGDAAVFKTRLDCTLAQHHQEQL